VEANSTKQTCHRCSREIQLLSQLKRTDGCPYCSSDLKVCLNCRFFDPGCNNQCREPAAEWCAEKDKANFCEFFEFREVSPLSQPGMGGAQAGRDGARQAFDGLFRKK
jgi:DNA-directed RNA polymerase subunit RPC12/RpoP